MGTLLRFQDTFRDVDPVVIARKARTARLSGKPRRFTRRERAALHAWSLKTPGTGWEWACFKIAAYGLDAEAEA